MSDYPYEDGDVIVLGLIAERDRLRAVVEAVRAVLAIIDSTTPGQMCAGLEGRDEITLLRQRLDRLDGSAETTDAATEASGE